jgi:galactonate dehydratase
VIPTIAHIETLACGAGWRNYYFVKLTTSDGVVGWSEYDEGFGNPGIGHVIGHLRERIVGRPVMQVEKLYFELRHATRPGTGGLIGQALGAIENALLDAKAKTLGVPCYELLGGKVRDRIQVYWSHCGTWRISRHPWYSPLVDTKAGVVALGREVRERGFRALKTNVYRYEDGKPVGWAQGWGIPFSPELNVTRKVTRGLREHLGALREGAGDDVEILLDLNFNAKTEGYLEILRSVADLELFWVEIDSFDPKALAYLRTQSRHTIASGETLMGLQEFLPFFEHQAMDVAIIDLVWNGAWQSMKIAACAEAHELNVAPHNFYGHLCTMMNAHFAAAVPNLRTFETDIDRIAWDSELYTHLPQFEDGQLLVPDRPGWGTEPVEAAIRAHPPNDLVNPIGLVTPGRSSR